MRRFLIRCILFILVPVILLAVLYFVSDPYKTLKPFSLQYFDITNRDYLSTELFLMNDGKYDYDSFIFSSSRGSGFNTYHWKEHLGEDARPFLFQAWGETVTGIEQKVSFLDARGNKLKNAIVLLDMPGSFIDNQHPTKALLIKDPTTSRQPRWIHQLILLYDFLQKPSQWIKAIKGITSPQKVNVSFDPVTNDWDKNDLYQDFDNPPTKDSLKNCSLQLRNEFIRDCASKTDDDLSTSNSVITEKQAGQLMHIKHIFDKHNTDYRVVISPGYCYTYPAVSPDDLETLYDIFGREKVFDYSGKNELTSDCYNFSDPNHFGKYIGWMIIENIYNGRTIEGKLK